MQKQFGGVFNEMTAQDTGKCYRKWTEECGGFSKFLGSRFKFLQQHAEGGQKTGVIGDGALRTECQTGLQISL
jgi:hypothetical protein